MFVLALVLVAVGAAVTVVGLLALGHRLPRNRVVGVRTPWTMSRIDTFRRANRAAAPAFLAAGGAGVVAGAGAVFSDGATAITLLVVGLLGLVGLLGAAGTIGVRFAAADEAAEVVDAAPSGPCTLGGDQADGLEAGSESCASVGGACAGACALCPHGSARA